MTMKSTDSPVLLGRVSGLFGVRGWVRIYSYTSPRENILAYPSWRLHQNGGEQAYTVSQGHRQGKGVVAQLEGISDRTTAESLLGAEIFVARDALQPPALNEYYWSDLVGCQVVNLQQEALGEVANLMETGANDVLIVKAEREERLIPFVDPWVQEVELDKRLIRVDWPSDF
ncbi:MAG: ribosome maturation factor RimM [Gammaproteobacteria bacterium]|jgi:16S rRNA processing protein RimM|nr:ribosome maturation factor RimM [Gammaproteobacteria bacterium]MBT7307360.1 ribosome maturation factor RimM [Gammaproteobacteria bacterium]